jgi:hypothetical protein
MVARGNKDLHRHSMSGLKVQETEEWGRDTARSRYSEPKYQNGAPQPKDASKPQRLGDANNLQGPGYRNEVSQNSWLRGGGESTEGQPGYGKIKQRR